MEFFRALKKEPGKADPPPAADPAKASIDDFLSKLSAEQGEKGKPTPPPAPPAAPPPVAASVVERPSAPSEPTADLATIAQRLSVLGQVLGETNEQFLAYLARREAAQSAVAAPQTSAAVEEKIVVVKDRVDTVKDKLDALGQKIDQLAVRPPADATATAPRPAGPNLEEGLKALIQYLRQKLEASEGRDNEAAQGMQRMYQAIDARLRELDGRFHEAIAARVQDVIDILRPAQPEPQPEPEWQQPQGTSQDWQRALFGPELSADGKLDFQRLQLCNQVLEGDPTACALAGQLLVFQSAAAEKMPQLLKEIGEAYYRWQPKAHGGPNPMELALVHWLQSRCDAAHVPNTIELVNPGERFDAARHHAAARGVEITEVYGWIVLRDNGKVYTKAIVGVR